MSHSPRFFSVYKTNSSNNAIYQSIKFRSSVCMYAFIFASQIKRTDELSLDDFRVVALTSFFFTVKSWYKINFTVFHCWAHIFWTDIDKKYVQFVGMDNCLLCTTLMKITWLFLQLLNCFEDKFYILISHWWVTEYM